MVFWIFFNLCSPDCPNGPIFKIHVGNKCDECTPLYVHEERMNEVIEDDEEFSEAHFDECLKILKQRNNKKYDFILKYGKVDHFNIFSEVSFLSLTSYTIVILNTMAFIQQFIS